VALRSAPGAHPGARTTTTTTAPPATPVSVLKRWAATNGGGSASQTVTAAQALADARNYDLLVALQKTFPPYLAAMRQANPHLLVLAYLNGAYAQASQGADFPDAWYARGADGAKIRSKKFGNYLMDVTNPGWIQNRAQTCSAYTGQSGYDGCYLDMLGNATVGKGYDTAAPIDPATHAAYTRSRWMAATSHLAGAVKAANATLFVVGNGLANGTQYFSSASGPTSALLASIDGGNAQGWLRSENDSATSFRPPAVWKSDVDMLVDAGTRGRAVLAMTKVGVATTPQQLLQLHRYALASFLLGTNGSQYFFFDPSGNNDGVNAPDTSDDHVNVGTPLAHYVALPNGAYRRQFSAGVVAVNPTTAPVAIALGGTFTDLDGHVVQTVTLPPHSGGVFTAPTAGVAGAAHPARARPGTGAPRSTPSTLLRDAAVPSGRPARARCRQPARGVASTVCASTRSLKATTSSGSSSSKASRHS
jgi:hypothetical protein